MVAERIPQAIGLLPRSNDVPHRFAGFLGTYARNVVETAVASRRPHDIFHATFYDPGAARFVGDAKLVVTVLDMIPERFPDFFKVTGPYGRLHHKAMDRG